ncbi:carnitine 3-dehydrogenase [uncultured Sulfitobacter sp.]|uniref:carnitine 3-dehydrogenase n=1 Tax=uncultured Sulfitobacter sp. TaxID=191468 RepID=UPI002634938B|nr:carnitine 3-dehydrogenase [uncultured Sulfitobacter sp.]
MKTAAIIGGGVIGGGWAARFMLNGWDVRIFDPDPEAERKIGEVIDNARRALPGLTDVVLPAEGTVTFCDSIATAAQDAAFIVEAVPERVEIKHKVYAEIEAVNTKGLIASSTSGIMPTDLQAGMAHPERLIVGHPFNPVYLLPLVELVAGKQTDPAHIETARGIYASLGMHPLHCRVEIEGFLSDRLQEALWREALWLLKDGVATAEELDAAIAYGPGLRWAQMGTMQTFHLAGGEGGMRAMLAMFGPCLKWPWTKLMDVPELTDDFVEMVGDQCDTQSGDLTPRALEHIRDDNLVGILRSLKANGWGAGATLQSHEAVLRKDTVHGAEAADLAADALVETAQRTVPLDWTDYNGHMTESRYLHAFADATDRFMQIIGCDAAYIKSGGSYFTAETHIRHIDEVHAGATITIRTRVVLGEGKKMHLFHEMYEGGRLLATGEHFLLHVSLETRKPTPPAPHIEAALVRFATGHAGLPAPEGVGRAIGAPR